MRFFSGIVFSSIVSLSAFAQTATAPQPSAVGMLAPFALMFGVLYFLVIRPQQKKMKEHQGILEKLQSGDQVVTASGIVGKVTSVNGKIATVEIADNVKVKFLKSQIASVNPDLNKLSAEKGA